MTDSWTEDEAVDKPRLRELLAEEEMTTTPHAEHIYGGHRVVDVAIEPRIEQDIARRDALRREELEHLTRLRDRVQQGMDEGLTDLESGTTMLLNISKARCALAGVGYYPGAF